MSMDIDQRLGRFSDSDITPKLMHVVLQALPMVEPLPSQSTLAELVALADPMAGPSQVANARQATQQESARTTLWVATGLDTGDGIMPVITGIRTALAMYLKRGTGQIHWRQQQEDDAALKALALSELVRRTFPGTPRERLRQLFTLPTGRATAAWFATVEITLPFIDEVIDQQAPVSAVVGRRIAAQAPRLAKLVGDDAVALARTQLDVLLPALDRLALDSIEHLNPIAKTLEDKLPEARAIAGGVGEVLATGADLLPVYRYLGTRLVAEQAAWAATGAQPDEVAAKFIDQFLPPEPAPPQVAEDADAGVVMDDARASAGSPEPGAEGAVEVAAASAAVLAGAPSPVSSEEPAPPPVPAEEPAPPPVPAQEPAPPPVPPEEPAPSPVSSEEPAPPPVPAEEPAPPPVPAEEPAPPPVPAEEPAPPPVPAEEPAPPPLPAEEPAPPPVPAEEPKQVAKPAAIPTPKPAPEPKPEPAPEPKPEPAPKPAPEPKPEPAPAPAPKPRPTPPDRPAERKPSPPQRKPVDFRSYGFDDEAPPPKRRSRLFIFTMIALVLGVLACAGGGAALVGAYYWDQQQSTHPKPSSSKPSSSKPSSSKPSSSKPSSSKPSSSKPSTKPSTKPSNGSKPQGGRQGPIRKRPRKH